MPSINNLPPLEVVTGTVMFPVVDYSVDPDATKKATFLQFRDYLEEAVSVKSVAGKIGVVTLNTSDIAGLNIISWSGLPTSTTATLGGVKVDGTSITISSGIISATPYSLPTATTSTLGGVKVDGTTITIDGSGVISGNASYTLTTATTSTLGGVIVGPGLSINSGILTVNNLTSVFSTGTTFQLNVDSAVPYVIGEPSIPGQAGYLIRRGVDLLNSAGLIWNDNYYINDGTSPLRRGIWESRLGVHSGGMATNFIRLNSTTSTSELNFFGTNDPTAVISVKGTTNYEQQVVHDDHIPNRKYVTDLFATTATDAILGGVKIGSGITAIDDGTISVTPYTLSTATDAILGGVKIGSGITAIDDGTISVALSTATSTVLGGVKIGSGLASYGDGTIYVTVGGGGGGGSITTQDEGNTLSTQTLSINFIGAGVTATNIADAITVRIDGGGGGGSGSFSGGAVANSTQFLDAAVSSTSATGAITVVGGIGVGQNSFFGAEVTIKAATISSSSSTGALTVVGGVGVGGSVFVNNNVTATTAVISGATAATSSTGALRVTGGVSVGESLYVANTVTAVTFANAGAGTPTIQSPSSIILDAQNEVKILGSPFTLWSRTVSELNSLAGVSAGAMAYCTNESGGAVPVFYDGSTWRRMTDRNVIS